MATKIDKADLDAPPAGTPAGGADDLSIMAPDRSIMVGGEWITVREYRYFEGAKVRDTAKEFFAALYELIGMGEQPPTFEAVEELIAKHAELVKFMVSVACDRDIAWAQNLGEAEGDEVVLTWWVVNAPFFIRRVLRKAAQERLSAGLASSTR